ncbi:hypothetical protein AC1031_008635 [Aphanomyces cochlioides]|nr:hypothetical protein AC1031_008635 [Aphanomyces cochlioides]
MRSLNDGSEGSDAAVTFSRTSLAELVDMRAAESTFRNLLRSLHIQSKEIERLKASIVSLEEKFVEQNSHYVESNRRHTAIEARIADVEATIRLPNVRNASLGSIVAANYKEIVNLREKMSRKIELPVVEEAWNRLDAKLSTEIQAIRKSSVNLELISSLHMSQDALHAKVVHLSAQIESKMDQVDVARIETAIAKLHAFIPRSSEMESNLLRLEERMKDAEFTCQHQAQISSVDIAKLREMLDAQSQLSTQEKSRCKETHQALDAIIQKCRRNIAACHDQLRELKSVHEREAMASKGQREKINQTLNHWVDEVKSELEQRLTIAAWARFKKTSDAALASKATTTDVESTYSRLDKIDAWAILCDSHVQLSMRFIDWFFHRGDAYEHNLQLVESQLKQLALRRQQEPFARFAD